jgi:hypothetical protein
MAESLWAEYLQGPWASTIGDDVLVTPAVINGWVKQQAQQYLSHEERNHGGHKISRAGNVPSQSHSYGSDGGECRCPLRANRSLRMAATRPGGVAQQSQSVQADEDGGAFVSGHTQGQR